AGWNKVTSPYWGLPQSSVDKIAPGGVQADIDWVRVEQKGCGPRGPGPSQRAPGRRTRRAPPVPARLLSLIYLSVGL
ncbi:hypothetical protein, partial [Streptomyces sp. DT18]